MTHPNPNLLSVKQTTTEGQRRAAVERLLALQQMVGQVVRDVAFGDASKTVVEGLCGHMEYVADQVRDDLGMARQA